MIVVTGGAGFIGSNLIRSLNLRGIRDIIIVDNLTNGQKIHNINDLIFCDYIDKDSLFEFISENFATIENIFHFGACSSTSETDGAYLMRNNYDYSKKLLRYCQAHRIPLVYASSASVYSRSIDDFQESRDNECPQNPYGFSKWTFDNLVRSTLENSEASRVVGLRFFNVYGPREFHKVNMCSPIFSFYKSLVDGGKVYIFDQTPLIECKTYARDFVYVDDCVSAAEWLAFEFEGSGIFNIGSGTAVGFDDIATHVVNRLGYSADSSIERIPFPEHLVKGYQPYTKANLENLRSTGCPINFRNVESGIDAYLKVLMDA